MRDADVGPRKGARAALFGSQAPSVAHFPLSFAFSLKSFFFFLKIPAKCSVTKTTTLKEHRRRWWALGVALPGL